MTPNGAGPGLPVAPRLRWQWGLLLLLATAALLFGLRPGAAPLAYSEFKMLLRAHRIERLQLSDSDISGALRTDGLERVLPPARAAALAKAGPVLAFRTLRVADPGLVAELDGAGVDYGAVPGTGWLPMLLAWSMPTLILLLLWSVIQKRGPWGGLLAAGRSHARRYLRQEAGVTFNDIAGIDEARDELMLIVEFLRQPERYRRLGGRIPKGVLIVGAPGTGKTLLAKAVAGEAGVPFFSISGSEFVEMFVGVGAARVRDLFQQAQSQAPCIIFIDELDALGKARGLAGYGGHEEHEQTLNQLLVELDGFESNAGVIVLAATNRPEVLDPALLRPGRFDRHIALDRPDLKGRQQILAVHTAHKRLAPGVDLNALAARCAGFAGADLANLVNEAALLAGGRDREQIEMLDFDQAFDRIVGGLEKKTRVMSPLEKETVAYHEAGHALLAEARPQADKVNKISIIPRGVAALGYTQQSPAEERHLLRRSELLQRLDVLLGGRVAEELAFGEASTGALDDLQRATALARQMVAGYGMSDKLGLACHLSTPALEDWRGRYAAPAGGAACSERTARTIDAEVSALLAASQQRARATLQSQRAALDALARRLIQTEVIDRPALLALLAEVAGADHKPPP